MTSEDKTALLRDIEREHPKTFLPTEMNLMVLAELAARQQQDPSFFTPEEALDIDQKINQELTILREKAFSHPNKKAAMEKFSLVQEYIDRARSRTSEASHDTSLEP